MARLIRRPTLRSNAITPNRITVHACGWSACRVWTGYVQTSASPTAAPPIVWRNRQSGVPYVSDGLVLQEYDALAGRPVRFGYHSATSTTGGTQRFEGSALAGNPGRLVAGASLAKWGLLDTRRGSAAPSRDAAAFSLLWRKTRAPPKSFAG